MQDLFNGHSYSSAPASKIVIEDSFRWIVGIFSRGGAIRVIQKANEINLRTFYPLRKNNKGEYVPLWVNYLFIEFQEAVTIDLCRSSAKFIRIISAHDEEGIMRPVLVRKGAVAESMSMLLAGRFNERTTQRRFYGKGSLVRVIEGIMADRKVRLEEDVFPDWRGNHRVKIDVNGLKATVELFNLAL